MTEFRVAYYLFTGLLYDLTGRYDLAFVVLGIVNIVMMVLMLVDGVIQLCCFQ